jgi:hypothetical protein
MRAALVCGAIALASCDERHTRNLHPVEAAQRLAYLRVAHVWDDVDVERRNLLAGPGGHGRFAFDEEVRCRFVQANPAVGGSSAKFFCARSDGEPLLVKYGSKEVQAEVLGSRLLWALGFQAARVYPVRVRCRECPQDPWAETRRTWRGGGVRGERLISKAIIKRLPDGDPIEEHEDQGWRWDELTLVDARAGGASRAELDALRLLAAFMQHGDSKPENHQLLCPSKAITRDGRCRRPVLMIADAGSTFGGGAELIIGSLGPLARAQLSAWTATAVWREKAACRARLAAQFGSVDPVISEEGRALLARQLARLDDDQIRDLFRAARVEQLDETTRGADGLERPVTVEDWLTAFKSRRAEIVDHRCPSRAY